MSDPITETVDVNLKAAIEFAGLWYGNLLPKSLDDRSFVQFAARAASLTGDLAPNARLKVDYASPAAYTDGTDIFLPAFYFVPEFYTALGIQLDDSVRAAIIVVNGSQIHESLHIRQRVTNLLKMASLTEEGSRLKSNNVFLRLLNIVEDLFIEAECHETFNDLYQFLQAKNDVLFNQFAVKKSFEALDDKLNVDNVIDALVLLKNVRHASLISDGMFTGHGLDKMAMLLETARNPKLPKFARVDIAVELYEELVRYAEEHGLEIDMGEPDEGFGEEGDLDIDRLQALSKLEQAVAAALRKALKLAKHEPDSESDDDDDEGDRSKKAKIGVLAGVTLLDLEEIAEGLNAELNELGFNCLVSKGEGSINLPSIPSLIYKDIVNSTNVFQKMAPNKQFIKLGNHLRYLRATKTVVSPPSDSGSKVIKRRLSRIAIDGKVLGEMDRVSQANGKVEIIILLDISGSTMHCWGLEPLVIEEARAAMGAFNGFMRAGVPCAVYAHTSTPTMSYAPLIFGVAAFRMPLSSSAIVTTADVEQRFGRIPKVNHSQNFDGLAIKYCAAKFTRRPSRKVMIVLSDGSPEAGLLYHGQRAIEHTMAVVKEVRKSGIAVVSMSLVHGVKADNDKIYGEKWNLPAYDNLLEPALLSLVGMFSMGRTE